MANPISPLTGMSNTSLVDTFQSKDIVKLYKDQLDIAVDQFFPNSEFFLYQCNDTGYRFYSPEGIAGDGPFYASLQERLGDGYYHNWKFENQMAYDAINPGDKVLDIGCGIGKFLDKAKDKAGEVCGLELNQKAIAVCREKGLTVYNEMIAEHGEHREGYYDVVCMFQVLEHIFDVKNFIEDSLRVLKKGGKFIIAVPNNEPYFQGWDKYCTLNLPPHHMGLWNKKVFEEFAPLFNLALKKVEYDITGPVKVEAYLRAKYMAGIKTPGGQHTQAEKIKMILLGAITVPLALIRKMTKGINGSHISVLFEKQ